MKNLQQAKKPISYISKALLVALACGGVGAAVEAISTHGLDNMTIQVAATAVAYLLLT